MVDDFDFYANSRSEKTYLSKSFPLDTDPNRRFRFLQRAIDGNEIIEFLNVKKEIVISTTPNQRQVVKALFCEDTREIEYLVIQRFETKTGKPHARTITFSKEKLSELLDFIASIETIPFKATDERRQFLNSNLKKSEIKNLIRAYPELVRYVVENELTKEDITSLGYRKKQLSLFESILNNQVDFDRLRREWNKAKPEAVWQQFFENNPWIFGWGLNYIFTTGLDGKKLELTVDGTDVMHSGKRVDALMKTRGLISSLCFVELKTHLTPLLEIDDYRKGAWAISREVAGGIAQVHTTVNLATENLQRKYVGTENGYATGEVSYLNLPKSYLIVGKLSEFIQNDRIHEAKFTSFELFRRQQMNPEIITFDELFERAQAGIAHETHKSVSRATTDEARSDIAV